jgi:predicted lipoprotein with Yx(FWY)xxD motif
MRKLLTVVGVLVLALLTATVAAATWRAAKPIKKVVISTRNVPGLGYVLVNGQGRTLYMFVPDKEKKVTCVGVCAKVWPPVRLPVGAKAAAAGRVKASLLGSDPNPAGGRVVTYAKWPLYTYITDRRAGIATGQALNLNGGLWYVLSPTGKIIRTKVHTTY